MCVCNGGSGGAGGGSGISVVCRAVIWHSDSTCNRVYVVYCSQLTHVHVCLVMQLSFAIPLLEKLQQRIEKPHHGRSPEVEYSASLCLRLGSLALVMAV